MGDYIPPEELEKFLAKCNDAKAAKAAKATADRAKIQSDNVGHRLLSKMGWKEGTMIREILPYNCINSVSRPSFLIVPVFALQERGWEAEGVALLIQFKLEV